MTEEELMSYFERGFQLLWTWLGHWDYDVERMD